MPRRTERRRFIPPLVKPRAVWTQDEIRRDTLLTAKLAQRPEATPLPTPPTIPNNKRKSKEPPPRLIELVFSEAGEVVELRSVKEQKKEITINVQPKHSRN